MNTCTSSYHFDSKDLSQSSALPIALQQPTATFSAADHAFMQLALDQAAIAASEGEVPVGAVLVCAGAVIATGRNACIASLDPTAHAEMQALRAGAKALGNYRMADCSLFVTLEPCAMCSGAVLQARLVRLVFGAYEPKSGAAGSVINVFANPKLNHQSLCQGGLQAEQSAGLLQAFFKSRRLAQAKTALPLRDDALRTPESAFAEWQEDRSSCRTHTLPSFMGWRMHFLDSQGYQEDSQEDSQKVNLNVPATALCLHGVAGWSCDYADLWQAWPGSRRWRLIAPDLLGFGKSDKPKKRSFHTLAQHRQSLVELLQSLEIHQPKWWLVERSMLPLALAVAEGLTEGLTKGQGSCLKALLVWANPQTTAPGSPGAKLHAAPFPDAGHRAGAAAFALALQNSAGSNGLAMPGWAAAIADFDQALVQTGKALAMAVKVTGQGVQGLESRLFAWPPGPQNGAAIGAFFGFNPVAVGYLNR